MVTCDSGVAATDGEPVKTACPEARREYADVLQALHDLWDGSIADRLDSQLLPYMSRHKMQRSMREFVASLESSAFGSALMESREFGVAWGELQSLLAKSLDGEESKFMLTLDHRLAHLFLEARAFGARKGRECGLTQSEQERLGSYRYYFGVDPATNAPRLWGVEARRWIERIGAAYARSAIYHLAGYLDSQERLFSRLSPMLEEEQTALSARVEIVRSLFSGSADVAERLGWTGSFPFSPITEPYRAQFNHAQRAYEKALSIFTDAFPLDLSAPEFEAALASFLGSCRKAHDSLARCYVRPPGASADCDCASVLLQAYEVCAYFPRESRSKVPQEVIDELHRIEKSRVINDLMPGQRKLGLRYAPDLREVMRPSHSDLIVIFEKGALTKRAVMFLPVLMRKGNMRRGDRRVIENVARRNRLEVDNGCVSWLPVTAGAHDALSRAARSGVDLYQWAMECGRDVSLAHGNYLVMGSFREGNPAEESHYRVGLKRAGTAYRSHGYTYHTVAESFFPFHSPAGPGAICDQTGGTFSV